MGSSTHVVGSGAQSADIRSSAASSIGAIRLTNEDSFLVRPPVFLVAEGMGGHANGDLASQAVVQAFSSFAAALPTATEVVREAIDSANRDVRALSPDDATALAVAGSTIAGVAIVEMDAGGSLGWMVFNVGDSRVYSWLDGELRQVTVDHSAVQELVENGSITSTEAEAHPDRNVVTRALGVDAAVTADG